MSRGVRNNNVGNIMKSNDQWKGLVGYDDDGYAIFESPEYGVRAKGRVLMTYGRQGRKTLPAIFEKYAPKGHGNNDPAAYAQFVANETGFSLNEELDLQDENTLMKLVQAMAVQENGRDALKDYTPDVYLAGIRAAISGEGITPKGKPIAATDDPLGLGEREVKPTIGTEVPEVKSFSAEGVEQAPKRKSYSRDFWESTGETLEDAENKSSWFGFTDVASAEAQQSLIGVAYRSAKMERGFETLDSMLTPTGFNRHTFTPEEIERIRNEVKDPAYINAVGGATPETLDNAIKLANENYAADLKRAEAGTAAQLSGGLFGAAIDPLSYVPLMGITGKGLKLTNKVFRVGSQTAVSAGISEAYLRGINGGEAHYANAMLAGAFFGSGMSVLSDLVGKALNRAKTDGAPKPLDEAGKVNNEFANPAMRLEARETARNTGGEDFSKVPPSDARVFHDDAAVPYADHPTEAGAVILQDRSIISAENPINPKTLKEFRELDPENTKAAWGIKTGGLTEIGLKVFRSDNENVRALGYDLVRSPTGMQDGSSGKFGATASDIHLLEGSLDKRDYNMINDHMKAAMADPEWTAGAVRLPKEAVRQEVYRRVATAIERPELRETLTKAERNVFDIVKDHLDRKRESMENPAKYGDSRARGFFPESRHKGTYFPNVYSRSAKQIFTRMFGGEEKLQEAISKSWLASYNSRPEVKTRVDDYLKELHGTQEVTMDMVEKYAKDKAYGISHTDKFTGRDVLEENITGMEGIGNNNFLEARNLFDSDVKVFIEGSPFSVNDLREFDLKTILPAYDRRVNGDIAIMGGTGKTTAELADEVARLRKTAQTGKEKAEVAALEDTIKILTGRARRNMDNAFETVARSMQDMSFFAKNAYMGAQNITEVAGMLAKGNTRAVLHGIPFIRDLAFRNKPVSGTEIKELHTMMFGRELDDSIRPRRQDIVQRLTENSDMSPAMANIVGSLKYGTGELAARWPLTKVLTETTNYILDAGRQGALGDVVSSTIAGKKTRWATDGFLNGASVSREQWDGIQALIRENVVQGADGKYTFKDKAAFAKDPRAMDLWRLTNKVAHETMLRTNDVSIQDSKAFNAWTKMALQFKSFTLKSLNSKFVRSYHEASKNDRAVDMALTFAISTGITSGYYVAQAHVKAYGLPEGEREGYLARALDPTMIAYAGMTRSSHLGAPLSLASMLAQPFGFDDYKMVRSTILPKGREEPDDRPIGKGQAAKWFAGRLGEGIMEQMPAMGYAANFAATLKNAYLYSTANNVPDEMEAMTGLMNTTRELVPNDPLTQQLLLHIYADQGIYIKGN